MATLKGSPYTVFVSGSVVEGEAFNLALATVKGSPYSVFVSGSVVEGEAFSLA